MKRFLILSLCVAGLILLTAPTAVEYALTINGNRLGNITIVEKDVWAVSLQDVSRALGSSVSLEPTLQLQENRLMVREAALNALKKVKEGELVPAVNKTETTMKVKAAPGQFLRVQKAGEISSHVVKLNGQAYVPVRDLVRAFGDGSVRGTFTGPLQPGGVNLHINGNTNGIIAILVGL